MRSTLSVVVGFVVLVGGVPAHAHHSYAGFDQDRTVSVTGAIDKILFANPHVVLTLRMPDSTVYTVTWMSGRQLNLQGVGADELTIGDVVVVSGSPSRQSDELAKITQVRRLSDGWTWRIENGRVSVR
jgi:hypothetical protein